MYLPCFCQLYHYTQVEESQKRLRFQIDRAVQIQLWPKTQEPPGLRVRKSILYMAQNVSKASDSHGHTEKDPPHPSRNTSYTSTGWLATLFPRHDALFNIAKNWQQEDNGSKYILFWFMGFSLK